MHLALVLGMCISALRIPQIYDGRSPHSSTTSTSPSQPTTMSQIPSEGRKGELQILYFASASTYTGKQAESLPAPTSVAGLFTLLEQKYPGIKEKVLGSCSLAVGGEYVEFDLESGEGGEKMIESGDEVAVIPPVSSG